MAVLLGTRFILVSAFQVLAKVDSTSPKVVLITPFLVLV
jgi:hypothetical protein